MKAVEKSFCALATEGTRVPAIEITLLIAMSRRVPVISTPIVGGHAGTTGKQLNPEGVAVTRGFVTINHGGTSDASRRPMMYWSSGLYRKVAPIVRNCPFPRSWIWFPSITEPSVSIKKLQCAASLPSIDDGVVS